MKTTVTIEVDLEDEERFLVDYHGQPHRVRLVRYEPGSETVTIYGAKVAKNGRENSNALPMLGRPLSDLPESLREHLDSYNIVKEI